MPYVGAMATTFVLPLAMGGVSALGGNVFTDAFGALALIASTPILAVLLIGLIFKLASKKQKTIAPIASSRAGYEIVEFDN